MIDGQKSGVTHIPCWLITDHRPWNRYVIRAEQVARPDLGILAAVYELVAPSVGPKYENPMQSLRRPPSRDDDHTAGSA